MNRKDTFDNNRKINMEEELQQRVVELETILKQQELKINLQQQQLEQQLLQINTQQQHVHQSQLQQVNVHQQEEPVQVQQGIVFQPDQIVREFRSIKPLNGNHNIRQFIQSVESTMALAVNNQALLAYGVRIIINEKLEGNAGRIVRELDNNATWEQVKEKLLSSLQSRKTYAEIFNFCRSVKVSNLNELFDIFIKAKYEINELYEVDVRKPIVYSPAYVDRDLVDLLMEKIDGPIRAHLDEHETLNNIITKYTKLKLLYDTRAIAFAHRIDLRNRQKSSYNKPFADVKTNNGYRTPKENWQNLRSNNFQSQNGRFQNTNNNFRTDNIQQLDRNFRSSGQGLNYNIHLGHQNMGNRQTRSNQTRNYNQSRQQRQSNFSGQETEPMEIGTIHEERDINFHIPPQGPPCP